MDTIKTTDFSPECFRHKDTVRRKKHRHRLLFMNWFILLPVFALLLLALYQFLPAFASTDGFFMSANHIENVPYISQLPALPTGCEGASAAMLLNFYGVEITAEEFAANYLPCGDAPHTDEMGQLVGCDPWEAFPGDPFSDGGWGCYSTVIERALNTALRDSNYRAERLMGLSMTDLRRYIDSGTPVILWATIDMETPYESDVWTVPETGLEIAWIYPMHALVLTGYDSAGYYFNDPLAGENIYYGKDSVETAYNALYHQAVILTE